MRKVTVTADIYYEKKIEISDEVYDRFIDSEDTEEDYWNLYKEIANLLPKNCYMSNLASIYDEEENVYLAEY